MGGQVRAMKDALEYNYKMVVDSKSDVLPWLVMYSSALLCRFQIGIDGKTAYQREQGKDFNRALPIFAECVHYLPLGKKGKMMQLMSRWEDGVYLGLRDGADEFYVGTKEGGHQDPVDQETTSFHQV